MSFLLLDFVYVSRFTFDHATITKISLALYPLAYLQLATLTDAVPIPYSTGSSIETSAKSVLTPFSILTIEVAMITMLSSHPPEFLST